MDVKQIERLEALLARMAEYAQHTRESEEACSDHPDAPHGFDRNGSHSLDRYVCDCEGWEPDPADEQFIARDATHFLRDHGPALLQLARAVSEAPRREVRECCGHLLVGNEWDEADAAIDAMRGQTVALLPVPVKEGKDADQ